MCATILRYHPSDALGLVQAYRSVFAGPPWNEFVKCKECQTVTGVPLCSAIPGIPPPCPECRSETEFYHQESDILERACHGNCYLLFDGGSITGFIWGWSCTPQELVIILEKRLGFKAPELTLPPTFFYMDEVGIIPEKRGGEGIAMLTRAIVADVTEDAMCFWTSTASPLYRIALGMRAKLVTLSPERVLGIANVEILKSILQVGDMDRIKRVLGSNTQ